jgi:hypothetical protein
MNLYLGVIAGLPQGLKTRRNCDSGLVRLFLSLFNSAKLGPGEGKSRWNFKALSFG